MPFNYLNNAKPLPTDYTKRIIIDKQLKDNLQLAYDHIKSVICSNGEELYEYVLYFIACTFAGIKVRKALYMQSDERTGKDKVANF